VRRQVGRDRLEVAPDAVAVRRGDVLRVSATYDTTRASWYESMGIMLGWVSADGPQGPDPFTTAPPASSGVLTHGHLAENDNHGGTPTGQPDPTALPDGPGAINNRVDIAAFEYLPGNNGLLSPLGNPPAVMQGTPLGFDNVDAAGQIFHTITACKAPCTGSTGISYPLADGPVDFDSGELGYGPPGVTAAANRHAWSTPANLAKGTYTYFCRVHPYMRGAFRVK